MTDFRSIIPFRKNTLDNEVQETVNARDLHAGLEISKEYRTWVRAQIKRLGLMQDIDFLPVTQKVELAQGGSYIEIEYFLTLDAGKHVALASQTPKGKEIRAYFIAAEKALRTMAPPEVFFNPQTQFAIDMLKRLDASEARQAAQQIEQLRAAEEQARFDRELIAQQGRIIEAFQQAERANAKADMALQDAHTMTLEDYVRKNGLTRQLPPPQWQKYARWLRDFCAEFGLSFGKTPVEGKETHQEENAYPLQALHALLRHETKKPKQLVIVPKS
jgi:phage anti-repressor protein